MSKKVTIHKKLVKDNKSNLSLNFYPPVFNRKTGKYTRFEKTSYFVYNDFYSEPFYYNDSQGKKQSKIQIVSDKNGKPKKLTLTPAQKHHNKENNEMIELYRAKRFKEITKPDIYTEAELKTLELAENKKKIFTDYFKVKADNAKSSIGTWKASYGYFMKFYGNVLFSDINKALIEEFRGKLLTTFQLKSTKHKLKRNSAASYFIKFVQVLEMAYDDNYLSQSFKRGIDWIKEEDTEKNFLTLDECKKLFTTDFSDEALKRYCIFALLSGLRYIDINSLRWQDLVEREGINYINFRIKKTSSFQYHPISKEAVALMGERKTKTDFVFERIKYHSINNDLRKWLIKAEIDKKVTFHNFRTSYAVIQLEAGADIYLISKMLGHKSVTTTQIYAKIVDSRKVSTINNIVLAL